MQFKTSTFVALIFLIGCVDQDPFGLSYKKLAGRYSLQKFESGDYYVVSPDTHEGGGVLEGTVEEVGWTDRIILAKRKAHFGGDLNGWMVIDVATGKVSGPLSEEVRRNDPQYAKILTEPPEAAWKR